MNEHVFVVKGTCGEYDSYSEWSVKAFLSLQECEKFLAAVTAEHKNLVEKFERQRYIPDGMKVLDTYKFSGFIDCRYEIEAIELGDEK